MNIILIGMPGCGKSTVGVVLAKMLGMSFVDSDLEIQKQAGARLQEIIDREGNDAFLELEAQVLSSLQLENTVLATGGSAVLTEKGRAALKRLGPLIYLEHPFCEIQYRVPNLASRGVTLKEGQTLRDLFLFRTPIYAASADFTVSAAKLSIEQTATAIIRTLKDAALLSDAFGFEFS